MTRRFLLGPVLAGFILICSPQAFQGAAPTRADARAHWTIPEEEHFLATAEIMSEEPVGRGITKPMKAILTDGRRTHAAHIQTIDVYMAHFHGTDGSDEADFKDSWKFNVAAYRLAKLLGLTEMVPVSVARTVDGKPAAVTWWIDDVLMDEHQRYDRNIDAPDAARWRDQMDTIRTFDQLIYNVDRTRENMLITRDWNVWMIDHTRSFRKSPTLRNSAAITQCNPALFHSLKRLKRSDVMRELGPYLTEEEIDRLMARRDMIVGLLAMHGVR